MSKHTEVSIPTDPVIASATTEAALAAAPKTKKATVKELRVSAKTSGSDAVKLAVLAFNASKENREVALRAAVDALAPFFRGEGGASPLERYGNVVLIRSALGMDAEHFGGLFPETLSGRLADIIGLARWADPVQVITGWLAAQSTVTRGELDERVFQRRQKALRTLLGDEGKRQRLTMKCAAFVEAVRPEIERAEARAAELATKALARAAKPRKGKAAAVPAPEAVAVAVAEAAAEAAPEAVAEAVAEAAAEAAPY